MGTMKKTAVFLSLALSAATVAAVDLTPRYLDIVGDGFVIHRLYFSDDKKKIGVSMDTETEVVSESGGVGFFFTKFPGASFSMRESTLTPKTPFSDNSLELYRANALTLIPQGTTGAKIEEEASDPIPVNNWHSYRFVFSYYTGTTSAKRSITFLNISDKQQLILITTATGQNFSIADARSHLIICSWHELQPDEEKPPTGN
jgi:hypothetical protein